MKEELIKLAEEAGFLSKLFYHRSVALEPIDFYLWMCELQKWLRDEKDVYVNVTPDSESGHRIPTRKYFVSVYSFLPNRNAQVSILRNKGDISYFVNPDKALEAGLIEALKLKP